MLTTTNTSHGIEVKYTGLNHKYREIVFDPDDLYFAHLAPRGRGQGIFNLVLILNDSMITFTEVMQYEYEWFKKVLISATKERTYYSYDGFPITIWDHVRLEEDGSVFLNMKNHTFMGMFDNGVLYVVYPSKQVEIDMTGKGDPKTELEFLALNFHPGNWYKTS